jgi:hypothetical protein
MKAFYSDTFVLSLPDGHRFPRLKYQRLRGSLAALTAHVFQVRERRRRLVTIHVNTIRDASRSAAAWLSSNPDRRPLHSA